jgi:hypothetical protein
MCAMPAGFSMMRGSPISMPETSVQFSYRLARTARATSAPVTSEPPREKVWMTPFLSAP